jgi:hypothetical protein
MGSSVSPEMEAPAAVDLAVEDEAWLCIPVCPAQKQGTVRSNANDATMPLRPAAGLPIHDRISPRKGDVRTVPDSSARPPDQQLGEIFNRQFLATELAGTSLEVIVLIIAYPP